MKYAVVYNSGSESKYVGSLSDYRCGEFSADPILMGEKEAAELMIALDTYVRNEEYIGNTDEDNEQAHFAYENGEWGFQIELMPPVIDYIGTLVNYGGDPMLIENEDDSEALGNAIDMAQNGIREIEKGTEEFEAALRRLNLTEDNNVQHIYSGVAGSEFVFCVANDWE